jgi:TonB family protein
MKDFLRFGIIGLLGTTLVLAERIPWSREQSQPPSGAPESQSENGSSTTPIDSTQEVFRVCSKTNAPPCLKPCSKKNPPPCAKPPHAVFAPEPEFAKEARKAHYTGVLTLTMVVGKDGRVSNVRTVGPPGMALDEKALEAFKKWKFDPATFDGKPVPVEVSLEVNFH